jgi:hypothetical protein
MTYAWHVMYYSTIHDGLLDDVQLDSLSDDAVARILGVSVDTSGSLAGAHPLTAEQEDELKHQHGLSSRYGISREVAAFLEAISN